MKRKFRISPLLLLAAVPLAALAAEPYQSPTQSANDTMAADPPGAGKAEAPLFKQLDVNHDGYVTKDEAQRSADITARFSQLDANHDGKISVDEFTKGMQGSQ